MKKYWKFNLHLWQEQLRNVRVSQFSSCFSWDETDKYSNQNKLFSVHFQQMPGFKGKRKRGLTLTLYKNPFRYRLPVSPPRKRTKTSSSTPFNWHLVFNLCMTTSTKWMFIYVRPMYVLKSCNIITCVDLRWSFRRL
jgi:hypothetical protein